MSLVNSTTKSSLVTALLTSSVLIASVSYMGVVQAANQDIADGTNTTTDPLNKGDFYNYVADPSTFTVLDDYNVTADGAGISFDNNNGGAVVPNTTLVFDGSSIVDGSIGETNPIGIINFNGLAGDLVRIEGISNADNLNFKNDGAVVFNADVKVGAALAGQDGGTATFNGLYNQAAGSIDLIDTFKVIFNDDANIAAGGLNLAGTGGAQVFSGKAVTIATDLDTIANSQLTFDLGLTATPGLFDVKNNANINGNEVVNIINPGLASYAVGVNGPTTIVQSVGATVAAPPATLNAPNNLFISFALSVDGANQLLQLTATRTIPTGLPGNIQGVAGVLGTVPAGNGALSDLVNQLGLLTTEQQKQALKSVAPLVDGAITEAVMDLQENTFDLFSRRITELQAGLSNYNSGYAAGHMDERGHGTWIKLFGRHTDQNERHDTEGYKAETWGIAAGLDMMLTNRLLLGVGLSWASVDVNHDLNSGDTDINNYQASLYGSWNICGPMFFNWMASAAYNDYDMTRHTIVGAFNQSTIADYPWLVNMALRGELGYVFGEEAFHITPNVSLTVCACRYRWLPRKTDLSTANQFVNYDDIDALWAGALGLNSLTILNASKSMIITRSAC
jgi:uncharacterized protein with beta-barrel porin domain